MSYRRRKLKCNNSRNQRGVFIPVSLLALPFVGIGMLITMWMGLTLAAQETTNMAAEAAALAAVRYIDNSDPASWDRVVKVARAVVGAYTFHGGDLKKFHPDFSEDRTYWDSLDGFGSVVGYMGPIYAQDFNLRVLRGHVSPSVGADGRFNYLFESLEDFSDPDLTWQQRNPGRSKILAMNAVGVDVSSYVSGGNMFGGNRDSIIAMVGPTAAKRPVAPFALLASDLVGADGALSSDLCDKDISFSRVNAGYRADCIGEGANCRDYPSYTWEPKKAAGDKDENFTADGGSSDADYYWKVDPKTTTIFGLAGIFSADQPEITFTSTDAEFRGVLQAVDSDLARGSEGQAGDYFLPLGETLSDESLDAAWRLVSNGNEPQREEISSWHSPFNQVFPLGIRQFGVNYSPPPDNEQVQKGIVPSRRLGYDETSSATFPYVLDADGVTKIYQQHYLSGISDSSAVMRYRVAVVEPDNGTNLSRSNVPPLRVIGFLMVHVLDVTNESAHYPQGAAGAPSEAEWAYSERVVRARLDCSTSLSISSAEDNGMQSGQLINPRMRQGSSFDPLRWREWGTVVPPFGQYDWVDAEGRVIREGDLFEPDAENAHY